MKLKYVKEFIFFPDVLILSSILLVSLGVSVWHLNSFLTWVALFVGMTLYFISEYMTHRFLFHMKPPKSVFFLKLIKRLHYDHHTKPNDLHLLFLPIWYTLPNLIITVGVVYLITSSLVITNAVLTGVISAMLFYEWKHYIAHRPVQPFTPWGRWVKKVHLWHHFKNENYWYGVTNPTLDFLMGTFKDEKKVEKSDTARNLEEPSKRTKSQ